MKGTKKSLGRGRGCEQPRLDRARICGRQRERGRVELKSNRHGHLHSINAGAVAPFRELQRENLKKIICEGDRRLQKGRKPSSVGSEGRGKRRGNNKRGGVAGPSPDGGCKATVGRSCRLFRKSPERPGEETGQGIDYSRGAKRRGRSGGE